MATQMNKANDPKKEVYIEKIKSNSENAAWVKKYKGVDLRKSINLRQRNG